MHRIVIIAALLAAFATPTFAQAPPDVGAEVDTAMQPLAWLAGSWEGEGWTQSAEGRETALVTERVEPRLDGRVLFVEGLGHVKQDDGSAGDVVHHAVGVVTFDPDRDRYVFMAFRDGHVVDAETSTEGDAFLWGFEVPGGRVRYRIRQDGGEWHETGSFSRDGGTTWQQFFEMRLHRAAP